MSLFLGWDTEKGGGGVEAIDKIPDLSFFGVVVITDFPNGSASPLLFDGNIGSSGGGSARFPLDTRFPHAAEVETGVTMAGRILFLTFRVIAVLFTFDPFSGVTMDCATDPRAGQLSSKAFLGDV